MAQIKFGTAQINKPTPANINMCVRVFTISGAIFLAWSSTTTVIGPNTKDIINQILGLFLGLANGLAPLFGVDVKASSVPTEDVTAVDTK